MIFLQYKLAPTTFTGFTILTWWYGVKRLTNSNERAIISVIKDNSYETGFHLHAGCKDSTDEICLTIANQARYGHRSMKQYTTKHRLLELPQYPRWNYFGFTYKPSTKGEFLISIT